MYRLDNTKILREHASTFQVAFDKTHEGIKVPIDELNDLDFGAVFILARGNSLQFDKISFYGTNVDRFIAAGSLTPHIQLAFAVPMEQIGINANQYKTSLEHTVGFAAIASGDNYSNGVAYPLKWDQKSKFLPLSDLTLVPQQVSTTTSIASTIASSTTTTIPTSSITSASKTESSQIQNPTPIDWRLQAAVILMVGVGAVIFVILRHKRKT